jgi:hypothetical protein
MFHRLIFFVVIAFWMIMTGLLIQTEVRPAKSRLLAVRPENVLKLIFHQEQASDLNIYNDRTRIGYLRIHPRIDKETGGKIVEFSGNLHLRIPSLDRQRFSWEGAVGMDADYKTQSVVAHFIVHEPANYRVQVFVDALAGQMRVTQHTNGRETGQTFPLDENGAGELLSSLQIDPSLLKSVRNTKTAPAEITAEKSSLQMHGERVETYLVRIEKNGQTWLEFHVDQLGQIATAKTLIGYTLAPYESLP